MKLTSKLFSDELALPDFLSQKYIPSLDGLRALSIIVVIVAHFNFYFNNKMVSDVVGGGRIGVHVFFVISGFLITTLLIKEKINKQDINLKNFYLRRVLRILPVAYSYIIVLIVLNFCFNIGIKSSFFIHQATFTENFNSFFAWKTKHYWSLSVEEQFYLIFPFLLKKNFKLYIIISFGLLALSPFLFVAVHYLVTHNRPIPFAIEYSGLFLNQGLYAIIVGSLTAIFLCKYPPTFNLGRVALSAIQCFLVYGIWYFFAHPMSAGVNLLVSALLISQLILSTIYFTDSLFYRILNIKIIRSIGVLSYSLYIWQQLFTYRQPWRPYFRGFESLLVPVNALAIICVAYLSYRYFERRFLILKNNYR